MSRARQIAQAAAFLIVALGGRIGWEGFQRVTGHEATMRVTGMDVAELRRTQTSPLIFEDRLPYGIDCPLPGQHLDRMLLLGGNWLTLVEVVEVDGDGKGRRWQAVSASGSGFSAKRPGGLAVMGSAACHPTVSGTAIRTLLGITKLHASTAEAATLQAALSRVSGPAQTEAVLSVGPDGRARLTGVVVNGQRIDLKGWPRR